MVNPVPGAALSTPWGRRGRHWSCRRDAAGNGIHTGSDFAAPTGTLVVAARPGVTRHVSFGASFGGRQLAVFVDDGTLDFYAHMSARVGTGVRVAAGERVGNVGTEGNSTGPHLHFERHATQRGWSCDNVTDPAPSIAWQPAGGRPLPEMDTPPPPPPPRWKEDVMRLISSDQGVALIGPNYVRGIAHQQERNLLVRLYGEPEHVNAFEFDQLTQILANPAGG